MQQKHPELPHPQAVFEIDYFLSNPGPFYQVAKGMYPGLYPPNAAHWLVRLLQDKEQLLRMYTQNIDGLEACKFLKKPHSDY